MARSPFQGTYRPGVRPTVVTAPDALVFINGESDIIGCPQCRKKFDLNKYITSIQTDLNVDSPPGSASINLSIPRHSIDEFYFDGNPLITPMMEVEIFAKGYYLVEGIPQYYPIFWGLTTEVSDQYSGGEHTFSINCQDILKWWELCKMNINPAFTQSKGQLGRSIFGNVFFGMNPYDVIWTLAQQSFGDVIVGSGSLVSLNKEAGQGSTFTTAFGDLMAYWNSRFSRIRSNLLLYGTQGTAVRGDTLYDQYTTDPRKPKSGSPFASSVVKKANGGNDGSQMVFDPTDPSVVAFRTQFPQAGQVNFWQSEYQTKLELANAAKEAIGYEFFMDVDGSIVFKPPFYNLDVLPNKPISWIQDIDVIDWDLSDSEAEVVTQIQVQGSFGGNVDYGFPEEVTPFTSVTDYHLLRKYGWRQQTYNSEFLGAPLLMFYVGMDMLDRYNARRYRGTVNIPLRPELRLGFPVYLASKDQVWYIVGISHNITFGGRAQTTLTLTAKRQKFVAPRGIGTINSYIQPTQPAQNQKKGKGGKVKPPAPPVFDPSTEKQLGGATVSTQQLTRNGVFELKVGEAAQLPPSIPDQEDLQSGVNPFEPLILRHPKTGRIVGYPNVVLAYTRPFATPPQQLKKVAGQGKNIQQKVAKIVKKAEAGAQKQLEEVTSEKNANSLDKVMEKQLTNRYSYGLNSAGVFTYCYDSARNIQEVIFPAKKRITAINQAGQVDDKILGKAGSAMIRPVSDERGFEVIGHFRYGRGVHLRDGSLVLNESSLNLTANVDTQVALAGGLFETLSAQSQGVSAITGDFPNPATTIARLQPTDTETAGRINPSTGEPEFLETELNLVDTAPLGSLKQKGLPISVEASQLSRALTLAEMRVKEETIPNEECVCLTGRADLAFLNVGYQVKTLTNANTTQDISLLPQTEAETAFNQERVDLLNRIKSIAEAESLAARNEVTKTARAEIELLEADPLTQGDLKALERLNKMKANLASAESQKAQDTAARLAYEKAAEREAQALAGQGFGDLIRDIQTFESLETPVSGRPTLGNVAPSGKHLQLRVETYLTNLYQALDDTHQEYEKALRGELVPGPALNPNDVRFGQGFPGQPELGPFQPPFNAPNRARGGDPIALANSAKSSIGDIQKTWSEFGDKLKDTAEKTKLEGEIQKDTRAIVRLKDRNEVLERVTKANEPGQTKKAIRVPGDAEKELADNNKEIARLEQQIVKNQRKLQPPQEES